MVTPGEKSISVIVANPQLAVRRVRGGIVGREYALAAESADTGTVDRKPKVTSYL